MGPDGTRAQRVAGQDAAVRRRGGPVGRRRRPTTTTSAGSWAAAASRASSRSVASLAAGCRSTVAPAASAAASAAGSTESKSPTARSTGQPRAWASSTPESAAMTNASRGVQGASSISSVGSPGRGAPPRRRRRRTEDAEWDGAMARSDRSNRSGRHEHGEPVDDAPCAGMTRIRCDGRRTHPPSQPAPIRGLPCSAPDPTPPPPSRNWASVPSFWVHFDAQNPGVWLSQLAFHSISVYDGGGRPGGGAAWTDHPRSGPGARDCPNEG